MERVYDLFHKLYKKEKPYVGEKLNVRELENALQVLAESISVVYFDNGNVDSSATFKGCDVNIQRLIWLFSNNFISNFFSVSKHPKYNALTPLCMYALKEHQGIKYQLWHDPRNYEDFEKHWLGKGLKQLPVAKVIKFDKKDLEGMDLTSYTNIPKVTSKLGIRRANRLSAILSCQLWAAHPAMRTPGVQILNHINWDLTPEPIWEIQDVIEEEEDL